MKIELTVTKTHVYLAGAVFVAFLAGGVAAILGGTFVIGLVGFLLGTALAIVLNLSKKGKGKDNGNRNPKPKSKDREEGFY